mgnify:CR=1 FL=1
MTANVSTENVGERSVYRLQHDWDDATELSTELVLALQQITGEDVTALEPISEAVNPEALNRLFTSIPDRENAGELAFRYAGNTITIHSSGDVRIVPETPAGTDERHWSDA